VVKAHHHNLVLEYAEITHPFHPFVGQKFPILQTRRVSGIETLVLKGSSRGTFTVMKEWTDQDQSVVHHSSLCEGSILDYQALLALTEILKILAKQEN